MVTIRLKLMNLKVSFLITIIKKSELLSKNLFKIRKINKFKIKK